MDIVDLEILSYGEIIVEEYYHHHKIKCFRRERWWADGTPFDVRKFGFVSLNRVDKKIRPGIGNELIKEHFENIEIEPKVKYFGQLEHSTFFDGTVMGFECSENIENKEVVKQTKQLCNQLVDFENTVVEIRKEMN